MKRIETLAAAIFGAGFLFLAGAVAIETTLRKVFNRSLQGVDELGGYILAVGAALSFVVALTARTHIRIDLIHLHLSRRLRILLNAFAAVSIAACALALVWMAWLALDDSILFNSTAQTPWATALKYPQSVWVGALALFLVVCVIEIVQMTSAALRADWIGLDDHYGPRGSKEELEEELEDLKARGVVEPRANATEPAP